MVTRGQARLALLQCNGDPLAVVRACIGQPSASNTAAGGLQVTPDKLADAFDAVAREAEDELAAMAAEDYERFRELFRRADNTLRLVSEAQAELETFVRSERASIEEAKQTLESLCAEVDDAADTAVQQRVEAHAKRLAGILSALEKSVSAMRRGDAGWDDRSIDMLLVDAELFARLRGEVAAAENILAGRPRVWLPADIVSGVGAVAGALLPLLDDALAAFLERNSVRRSPSAERLASTISPLASLSQSRPQSPKKSSSAHPLSNQQEIGEHQSHDYSQTATQRLWRRLAMIHVRLGKAGALSDAFARTVLRVRLLDALRGSYEADARRSIAHVAERTFDALLSGIRSLRTEWFSWRTNDSDSHIADALLGCCAHGPAFAALVRDMAAVSEPSRMRPAYVAAEAHLLAATQAFGALAVAPALRAMTGAWPLALYFQQCAAQISAGVEAAASANDPAGALGALWAHHVLPKMTLRPLDPRFERFFVSSLGQIHADLARRTRRCVTLIENGDSESFAVGQTLFCEVRVAMNALLAFAHEFTASDAYRRVFNDDERNAAVLRAVARLETHTDELTARFAQRVQRQLMDVASFDEVSALAELLEAVPPAMHPHIDVATAVAAWHEHLLVLRGRLQAAVDVQERLRAIVPEEASDGPAADLRAFERDVADCTARIDVAVSSHGTMRSPHTTERDVGLLAERNPAVESGNIVQSSPVAEAPQGAESEDMTDSDPESLPEPLSAENSLYATQSTQLLEPDIIESIPERNPVV